jgi:hypothetical protein
MTAALAAKRGRERNQERVGKREATPTAPEQERPPSGTPETAEKSTSPDLTVPTLTGPQMKFLAARLHAKMQAKREATPAPQALRSISPSQMRDLAILAQERMTAALAEKASRAESEAAPKPTAAGPREGERK